MSGVNTICRCLAFALIIELVGSSAWAARGARVDDEDVPVYVNPDAKSKVLTRLKQGIEIVASNLPTQGFYKVRLRNKTVGWIAADTLALRPIPTATPSPSNSPPGDSAF